MIGGTIAAAVSTGFVFDCYNSRSMVYLGESIEYEKEVERVTGLPLPSLARDFSKLISFAGDEMVIVDMKL